MSTALYGQSDGSIQALQEKIKQIDDDTTKVKELATLAWKLAETQSHTRRVHEVADTISILSDRLYYAHGKALADFYHGVSFRHEGEYEKALVHLERAAESFSIRNSLLNLANTLYQESVIESHRGNYTESLSIQLRMLEIYRERHAPEGIATALSAIAQNYYMSSDYDLAIENYRKSLSIRDSLYPGRSNQGIALDISSIGKCYMYKEAYDSARKYFLVAYNIVEEINSPWAIANELDNLGDSYAKQLEYQKAIEYYLKALPIHLDLDQNYELAYTYSKLGNAFLALRRYPEARLSIEKSLKLSEEIGASDLALYLYGLMSDLMERTDNPKEALQYARKFIDLRDSIYNEQESRTLRELQSRYQASEKDNQIMGLKQENLIQEAKVARQNNFNRVILLILVSVLCAGVLIFYISRQRKLLNTQKSLLEKENIGRQLTELKMQALRAQINPHFIFNCMNSINTMVLKGETENASKYLVRFSKLMRLILDNSENSTVSISREVEMLRYYLDLEMLRFPGKITYNIQVDANLSPEDSRIPTMLIQPVVENAIWHGLMHKEDGTPGRIDITLQKCDDDVLCIVEDNGIGRERAMKLKDRSILKNESKGLKLTEQRLRLSSRITNAVMSFTDLMDQNNAPLGTRVSLTIPQHE